MNLCIIPTPPSLASAIAILDSVTESMLALIIGMLRLTFDESRVFRLVCDRDTIGDFLGTKRTSSKVRPSLKYNITLIHIMF
ncbi:hypothetical protein NARC_150089 [Candidatus Nitrosocosmicus arcticus]|uniref:Uncharacterized protein n=1 Tax=Candidatus Nitrosocosmicus arcticus TaxID=2035267 RepID=A0A557SSC5_9ARCH|nr:hypothetical protein NARC_150089 [Candidatus Nitrosocosmicus arcticus]